DHIDEKGFRRRVAVQDVVLATLLVVEHELYRHVGATRPLGIWWIGAVAQQVAGIAHGVPRCRSPKFYERGEAAAASRAKVDQFVQNCPARSYTRRNTAQ